MQVFGGMLPEKYFSLEAFKRNKLKCFTVLSNGLHGGRKLKAYGYQVLIQTQKKV